MLLVAPPYVRALISYKQINSLGSVDTQHHY